MSNMEITEDKRETKREQRRKGGLIAIPFIFANEMTEKVSLAGFQTNLVPYLTQQLHMPLTQAANTMTNFAGTSNLMTLLGAFISDSFAGKFWTILGASIFYQIATICMTVSATAPELRPALGQEARGGQLTILYAALLLAAIGIGGFRSCLVSFGAEQFDEKDPKQKKYLAKYFNVYYILFAISQGIGMTVVVYIQDNIGWNWGFGLISLLMFLSIVAFIIGYPLFRQLNPVESPYTRLVQVCMAAYKKRKLPRETDPRLLYENDPLDASISINGKLVHTEELRFLDKAAIVTEEDNTKAPNKWKLNTVHRVEELKSMIRMIPLWFAGITFFTAAAQQNTFVVQQAQTMDRHITKSFQIPASSLYVFIMIFMCITTVIYTRVFIPIARRFTGLDRGITILQRMGIGFTVGILITFVAGFLEIKRKQVASAHGLLDNPRATIPISVFWLLPQFALNGVADVFVALGYIEFFYDQSPESMRSSAMALWSTMNAGGQYFSSFLVFMVHKFTASKNGLNWLPDHNLNKGKLENFYWLITILQVLNLIYYLICSKSYTYKSIQQPTMAEEVEKNEDQLELTNHV